MMLARKLPYFNTKTLTLNNMDTEEKKQECFLNGFDDGLAYALETHDFEKF
jgi:hypothetical protein